MSKCKCWVNQADLAIRRCPFHAAAEEMRALLTQWATASPFAGIVAEHNLKQQARTLLARIDKEDKP